MPSAPRINRTTLIFVGVIALLGLLYLAFVTLLGQGLADIPSN
jgi:hypothetical protein